jgi:hypothetical protein
MPAPHPEWPAVRIVHLTGGCRAYNGFDPLLEFEPAMVSGQEVRMNIREYKSLYDDLGRAGLAIIGCDFISSSLEAKALIPTDWRTFHSWPGTIWLCQEEIDRWSGIGYAGSKAKKPGLRDIARRVSHQLRVCAWRLRQISEGYQEQLHAQTADGEFRSGIRFEDGFTWLGYLSIQAFLVDACVLRDYLAEFYAMYACPEPDLLVSGPQITSMSGLKKRVLDKLSSTNPVTHELKLATSKGGWLHLLGAYRDLVVHCVPLAKSDSSLKALTTELSIQGAGMLPAVSLPLPNDPLAISQSRAAGAHLTTLEDELSLFVKANRGAAPSKDGLIYAYICLDNLTKLVHNISAHSPLPPEIPHITDDDVIGEIKVIRI